MAGENLVGKVVLEAGSGRGDTTRQLAKRLSEQPGNTLIVTDISDAHFASLQAELSGAPVNIRFIKTSAVLLEGIQTRTVDEVVCNYSLCAINAQAGQGLLALKRFWQVLKFGGKVWIEEEFPIDHASNPAQRIWAEKWRILRSAAILCGDLPYAEFAPETLRALSLIAGFCRVEWEADQAFLENGEWLPFFEQRLERLCARFPNESLRVAYNQLASGLKAQASQVGGMQIPYYRWWAEK